MFWESSKRLLIVLCSIGSTHSRLVVIVYIFILRQDEDEDKVEALDTLS